MSKSLLAFDTDRIKSYVFATGKLKEIRGASAILDELNRKAMVDIVEKMEGHKIYANGGSGLFILDSNRAEEARVAVEKRYRQETGTASITGVSVELPPDYKEGDDIQPYFQTLGYRLRAAKDGKPGSAALVTHPYLRFCDSCGTEYAEEEYTESGETALLCASCKKKRDKDWRIKGKEIPHILQQTLAGQQPNGAGLWHYLLPALHSRQADFPLEGYGRPDDFNDLAGMSHPKNYIGLIYADGDSMGKELENLQSEIDFEDFSEAIDNSMHEAVAQAIAEHLQPDASQEAWPFDILLLGGDDLVMVTPADKVLEVGLTVMEQFSQLTGNKLNRASGLNLSVGIAISHANYPFGQLLSLAESTLKFAKKEGAKRRQAGEKWAGGLLNFVVVSSANHLEFGEYYREDLAAYADVDDEHSGNPKNLFRTLRPYNAADFKKLLVAARSEPMMKMPRGKLQQLRHALFKSKNQSLIDGLTILFHWRNEKQRDAIQKIVNNEFNKQQKHGQMFPWYQTGPKSNPEYYTPLLDLIEIFDFAGGSKREKANE